MAPDTGPAAWFADCADAALDQCRAALASIQTPVCSRTKRNVFGQTEPVSDADLAIEDILTSAFAASDTGLPVIAEERRPDLDRIPGQCIVIDPIDGTVPFLCGSPLYATTVCLVHDDRPACAVVELPAFGVRVQARSGQGLHIAGSVTALPDFGSGSVLMSPAQMPWLHDAGREAGFAVAKAVPATSVKMLMVALGRADAAVRVPAVTASVAPWDCIAPALIVREAGGTVRDDRNRDLALTAPSPVNGWLACRNPQFIGPLCQIMTRAGEGGRGDI